MVNKKPKNYNEIRLLKKCYTFPEYYSNITQSIFEEIYNFLKQSSDNSIEADRQLLSFVDSKKNVVKTFPLTPVEDSFEKIVINKYDTYVFPNVESRSSSKTNDNK